MLLKDKVFVDKLEITNMNNSIIKVLSKKEKPKSYHIVTYGCQMNVNDSQKLSFMLESMGITETKVKNSADLIIFNTCCIRENAERRALGNIMWLKELKKKNPDIIICVCGCMVQHEDMLPKLLKQYKFVDIAFGTHNIHKFPELLLTWLENKNQLVNISEDHVIAEGLEVKRDIPFLSYLTIMYGCNNFCSYCVVPYVRGRERSRRFYDIIKDAETLINKGVKEITLLGQNVNSYYDEPEKLNFPNLLEKLDEIGVPRIRFMTSHPKDLSDQLIDVMANSKNIERHIHLPVQAGNNEVLNAMNRNYTREHYLNLVDKLKQNIPGIGITTDIIVAFPGETESQFSETLDLVKRVGYDSAFTFIYSKRNGTKAAKMDGFIPNDIANDRLQRLNDEINIISKNILSNQIGKEEVLLIDDSINNREEKYLIGRTSRNLKVKIEENPDNVGKFIPVKIDGISKNTLTASRI